MVCSLTDDSAEQQTEKKTWGQVIDESFPYCLSIGMSPHEYWDEDPYLMRAYIKAQRLKDERAKREAWMQGAYFYNALCAVSPVLHAFAKAGTKPVEYPAYETTQTKKEEENIEDLVEDSRNRFLAQVAKLATSKTEKGGDDNGCGQS